MSNQAELERENLIANRTKRFREVFADEIAIAELEALVMSDVHPSEAEELHKKGCPPELVVKILT
jgi:hypothetical protein